MLRITAASRVAQRIVPTWKGSLRVASAARVALRANDAFDSIPPMKFFTGQP